MISWNLKLVFWDLLCFGSVLFLSEMRKKKLGASTQKNYLNEKENYEFFELSALVKLCSSFPVTIFLFTNHFNIIHSYDITESNTIAIKQYWEKTYYIGLLCIKLACGLTKIWYTRVKKNVEKTLNLNQRNEILLGKINLLKTSKGRYYFVISCVVYSLFHFNNIIRLMWSRSKKANGTFSV